MYVGVLKFELPSTVVQTNIYRVTSFDTPFVLVSFRFNGCLKEREVVIVFK